MSAEIEICCVSTQYGLVTLAAALDAGVLPTAARRMLVLSDTTTTPETHRRLQELPGFAALAGHFDQVEDLNHTLRPRHPRHWQPSADDLPLLERHLRLVWDLGDAPVRLVLESLHAAPAFSLAQVFPDAALDVYADGLMVYGPTRIRMPDLIGTRIARLIWPDLLPGVTPLLLSEWSPEHVRIAPSVLRHRFEDLAAGLPSPAPGPFALILGQYFAALGILNAAEEIDLLVGMVRAAARQGHRHVVVKPHPSSQLTSAMLTAAIADLADVQCTVLDDPTPAEVLYASAPVAQVISSFSTGLATAQGIFDIPAATSGTELLLRRLRPYANSNRIPLMLIDHLLPRIDRPEALPPDPVLTQPLLDTVAFTMQPRTTPQLRPTAHAVAEAHPDLVARYVSRRRLTALDLPGGHTPAGLDLRGLSRRAQLLPVAGPALSRWQRRLARRMLR